MTIENMLKEILSSPYIVTSTLAVGVVEAGCYVIKYMDYRNLKRRVTRNLEMSVTYDKEGVVKGRLNTIKNILILPTPVDAIIAVLYYVNMIRHDKHKEKNKK